MTKSNPVHPQHQQKTDYRIQNEKVTNIKTINENKLRNPDTKMDISSQARKFRAKFIKQNNGHLIVRHDESRITRNGKRGGS